VGIVTGLVELLAVLVDGAEQHMVVIDVQVDVIVREVGDGTPLADGGDRRGAVRHKQEYT
jgi:hypothetical protein